jgi:hypothetical protein
MNTKNRIEIKELAESRNGLKDYDTNTGAATTADLLHADKHAIVSVKGCAALLLWQAMQFNGQWDENAVAETWAWMKFAIVV